MSLTKLLEDLSLSEIQLISQLFQSCLSAEIDQKSLYNHLISPVMSSSFSIKKLIIGYKLSSSSLSFLHSSKICILDLEGHFFEIKPPGMTIASFKTERQAPRIHFSFSKTDDKVIIFGGKSEESFNFLSEILIFDLNEKVWMSFELENPPVARFLHCSCAIGEYLFIYAGFSKIGWLRDLNVVELNSLNVEKIRVSGFVSRPQTSMVSVAVNNDIYIFSTSENSDFKQNQFLLMEIRNFTAKIFELSILTDFIVDKVVSGQVSGNLIVFIAIVNECFCVLCYDFVFRSWKRAWNLEDSDIDIRAEKKELIPVIFGGDVYVIGFYNNFYVKGDLD